ncbi:MAG TPA: hypothetical protein VG367_01615 [Mucilaginibacter sp.]|jgi:hypothetical protein|nr:hypothetical protein [Mucilaginibacter sp.]
MSDYDKIRSFETEILDRVHVEFEFYKYSEDIVIPHLLQFFGDIERRRGDFIERGFTEISFSFYLTNMMHGISHCIRWIKKQNNPQFVNSDHQSPHYIHRISADFVNWGISYHAIAQEFIIWSRKIKQAILNEENKTITFVHPLDYDYSKVHGLQLLYDAQLQDIYSHYPHEKMEEEFSLWLSDIDLLNPPIANSIDWAKGTRSESYPLLLRKMSEIVFPELPNSTDFQGYNLLELRQFFALFFLNFHFIRWVEGVLDDKYGMDHSFGSNPLYLTSSHFRRLASKITGLSFSVVGAIITDLTFDHNNFHSSITIQPFILSGSDVYYILPNLFTQLEPSRMITGSLNKGPKKKIYDKLINKIERVCLERLEGIIKEGGFWKCYNTKTIKYNGKQYQPDLIIIDHTEAMLCVVDYKHFVGPITASEVEYRMNETKKGINQVVGYVSVLSQIKKIATENIERYSVYGILLTHKPMPIPIPLNTGIVITDSNSFTTAIAKCHQNNHSLNHLLNNLRHEDLNYVNDDFIGEDAEVNIKDWKIIRKVFKKQSS